MNTPVKLGLFRDDQGHPSSLRVLVVPGGWIALATVIAGVVAMFLDKSASAAAIATGGTIFATAVGAKAWQKLTEGRNGAKV